MEENLIDVSGFMNPSGDLFATSSRGEHGSHHYLGSTLQIDGQSGKVTMGRPSGTNHRYMPTIETLSYEADGSRTVTEEYTFWRH